MKIYKNVVSSSSGNLTKALIRFNHWEAKTKKKNHKIIFTSFNQSHRLTLDIIQDQARRISIQVKEITQSAKYTANDKWRRNIRLYFSASSEVVGAFKAGNAQAIKAIGNIVKDFMISFDWMCQKTVKAKWDR